MDSSRSAARLKSYTGSAILVLVLYFVFYVPGLIANFMYYNDAKRMEDIAGERLPGVGCLQAQLYLAVCTFVAAAMVILGIAIFGGAH
jgi:hypothetical protein